MGIRQSKEGVLLLMSRLVKRFRVKGPREAAKMRTIIEHIKKRKVIQAARDNGEDEEDTIAALDKELAALEERRTTLEASKADLFQQFRNALTMSQSAAMPLGAALPNTPPVQPRPPPPEASD